MNVLCELGKIVLVKFRFWRKMPEKILDKNGPIDDISLVLAFKL